MNYLDFFDIACNLNKNNRGKFTPREIANIAYIYYDEYKLSLSEGKPTLAMLGLCAELVYDMDWADYEDDEVKLDIETMKRILEESIN